MNLDLFPKLPEHIDSTMRSCFVQCPQKFFLEFCHGFRPPGISIDLHAGGCFASAVEETYKNIHIAKRPLNEALLRGQARFFTEWGDFVIPEWKKTAKTADRTWEAVETYFREWPPLTDHVQPFFDANGKPTFEYTFAIPLEPAIPPSYMTLRHNDGISSGTAQAVEVINNPDTEVNGVKCFPTHPNGSPFLYTGRFDMLGTYNNRPCVKDDKTQGGSIVSEWAEKWDLRSQFLGYVWACQQCGIDLDTVVVRGIAIQKTQFGFVEAAKTYSKFLIDRWHEQLRRDLWRMRRAYDERYFDYNLGDACTTFGNCIFTRCCQSANPENWHQEFVVRHWNPLEKNPVKETP